MDKIPPEHATHYDFEPRRPPNPPPVGSNYLMHRFKSPKACRDGTLCLTKIPKRVKGKPKYGEPPDYEVAWGLHFMETLSWPRISLLGLLSLILSVLAGVLWNVIVKDNSAIAAATYVWMFEVFGLTVLQNALK